MAFEAGVDVALGVILEVTEVVFAIRLALAVQHGNVRCHLTVQQPRQKWSRAVRPIGGDRVWLEVMPLGTALHHRFGRDDFLAQPRWCCLDVHDDPVAGVDHVIGLVAEAARPILQ